MTDLCFDHSSRLERSWRNNAQAWTDAVREQRIASRRAGTDAAVVGAVIESGAKRVLDIGCGEGWLARELSAHGVDVVGVDASPELIDTARAAGGRFETIGYCALAQHADELGRFDAAVFNFALLDKDLATPLGAAHALLARGGTLILQTVHPWLACGDAVYANAWRSETFEAFGGEFRDAMPWYFRTLSSWVAHLRDADFAVSQVREPLDATSGKPLSLLLVATAIEKTDAAE